MHCGEKSGDHLASSERELVKLNFSLWKWENWTFLVFHPIWRMNEDFVQGNLRSFVILGLLPRLQLTEFDLYVKTFEKSTRAWEMFTRGPCCHCLISLIYLIRICKWLGLICMGRLLRTNGSIGDIHKGTMLPAREWHLGEGWSVLAWMLVNWCEWRQSGHQPDTINSCRPATKCSWYKCSRIKDKNQGSRITNQGSRTKNQGWRIKEKI